METIVMKYINHEGHTNLAMMNESQDALTILDQDTMQMKNIFDVWAIDYLLEDVSNFDNVSIKNAFFENLIEYMKQDEEYYEVMIAELKKVTIVA